MFNNLFLELRNDREKFVTSLDRFDHLLTLVGDKLQKRATQLRVPISPAERLLLTLRYSTSETS